MVFATQPDTNNPPGEEAHASSNMRPGKIDRIAKESQGLIDDIRDWVQLKVTGYILKVEDDRKYQSNAVLRYGIIVFLAATAAVFLLTASSLALGTVLGHTGWGFLVIAGVLTVAAGVLYLVQVRWRQKRNQSRLIVRQGGVQNGDRNRQADPS